MEGAERRLLMLGESEFASFARNRNRMAWRFWRGNRDREGFRVWKVFSMRRVLARDLYCTQRSRLLYVLMCTHVTSSRPDGDNCNKPMVESSRSRPWCRVLEV
jgi:hypothetical protein